MDNLIWIDFVLLGIVAISALFSLFRGFTKEVLSLIGWALSFWLATKYAAQLMPYFSSFVTQEGLQYGAAFLVLFSAALVACMLLNHFIGGLITVSGLGVIDRLVGVIFGLIRGVIIGSIIVLIGNMTPLSGQQEWQTSTMIGYFKPVTHWTLGKMPKKLPEDIKGKIENSLGESINLVKPLSDTLNKKERVDVKNLLREKAEQNN